MLDFVSGKERTRKNIYDSMNKGDLSNAFDYSNSITFDWKGSKIKDALTRLLVKNTAKKETIIPILDDLEEVIGFAPDQEMSSYNYGGFQDSIKEAYPDYTKTYSWQYCKNGDNNYACVETPDFQTGTSTASAIDTAKLCCEYNNLLGNLISICCDIYQTKLMIDNIDDKKTYTLNNSQVKVLTPYS